MSATQENTCTHDGHQGSDFEKRRELLVDTGSLNADVVQNAEEKNDGKSRDYPSILI